MVVNELVIVEVKSVARIEAVHVAQVLTYLRVMALRIGLLLNFNSATLKSGIRRVIR